MLPTQRTSNIIDAESSTLGPNKTKLAIDVYPEHVLGRHVARYVAVLLVYLPRLLCVTYRMSSLAYVYNACTCLLQTCPDAFGVRE